MANALAQLLPRRTFGFAGQEGETFDAANQLPSGDVNSLSPLITNQSLGYGQQGIPQSQMQGSPVDVFGQGKGYAQPDGTIIGVNAQGQKFKVQSEGTDALNQARADAMMKRKMLQAQIEDTLAQVKQRNADVANKGAEPAPKAPPGTRVFKDVEGNWQAEVIKNTPQWQTLKSKEAADRSVVQNIVPTLEKNADQIDELIKHEGFDSLFGVIASRTPELFGSSRDAKAKLDQVVGAMETAGMQLQKSSAGSAGAMSEKEWPKMQTYLNIVKTSSDPAAARQALQMAKISYERMVSTAKENYQNEWANGQFGDKSVIERLNNRNTQPDAQGGRFGNADKESRYQAWKAQQGR